MQSGMAGNDQSSSKLYTGYVTQTINASNGYHAIIEESNNSRKEGILHLCNGASYLRGTINPSEEQMDEDLSSLASLSSKERMEAIIQSIKKENKDKVSVDEKKQEYRVSADWGLEFDDNCVRVDVAAISLTLQKSSSEFLRLAMHHIAETRAKTKETRSKRKAVREEIDNLQQAHDILQEFTQKRDERVDLLVGTLNKYKKDLIKEAIHSK